MCSAARHRYAKVWLNHCAARAGSGSSCKSVGAGRLCFHIQNTLAAQRQAASSIQVRYQLGQRIVARSLPVTHKVSHTLNRRP